ncbi:MAG: DNA polymerase III subunit beta [Candidatus Bipolaricaulota bacterium]|nr:DNA polymerase III subunit beta [Candidatus Bipolaricaulota bacterium]MDW8151406.1 DNA polymerase III subunit beta [Candidatus Bipolaricaulota bacterium]
MNVTLRREDLEFGVRTVSHALGGRTAMPILSGIKITALGDGLEFAATDLAKAIRCRVPAQVRARGITVLPGQVLSQLVGRLPAVPEVELESLDAQTRLRCGPSTFELPVLAADEYPQLPEPTTDPLGRIALPQLLQAIHQTAFAALKASETTRLALTGVDIVFKEGGAKFAATNGYRLAIKRVPVLDLPDRYEGAFLVDAGILGDLHRVLSGLPEDYVSVYAEAGQIHFQAGPVLFSARLIQEQFPDFERVIPKDNPIGLFLPREEFLETLRRTELFAAEESGAVTLRATAQSTALEVSAASRERGKSQEVVELVRPPARGIEIAFKAEYLIDALRRMESEQVALWLSAPERAGLLEPAGNLAPEDEGFLYVCMPVRLL